MKKEILYFVGGVLIGGSAGGYAGYILTKKKYEKKINEELDKLKDQNRKDVEQAKKDVLDDISEEHLIVKKPSEEELKDEAQALINTVDKFVNYSSYYSEKEEPNGDDTCDEDIADELYPVEDEDKIPYFIDEDAIESSYDIVCLTYYEKDRTLADDVSAQIVLPQDTISEKLLDQFVRGGEDQTYICRDSHSTVYEVTRYPGSYSEEVLGLLDDYGGVEDGGDIDT